MSGNLTITVLILVDLVSFLPHQSIPNPFINPDYLFVSIFHYLKLKLLAKFPALNYENYVYLSL